MFLCLILNLNVIVTLDCSLFLYNFPLILLYCVSHIIVYIIITLLLYPLELNFNFNNSLNCHIPVINYFTNSIYNVCIICGIS